MLNLIELAELITRYGFNDYVWAFEDWIRNDDRVAVVDDVIDVLLLLNNLDFSQRRIAGGQIRIFIDIRWTAKERIRSHIAASNRLDRHVVVRIFWFV